MKTYGKSAVGFIGIMLFFQFDSCVNTNESRPLTIHADSSKNVIDNIGLMKLLSGGGPSVITEYDKNKLPQAIRDYYTQKWGGFDIANPDENWDGGCSGGIGIIDTVDKNGKKHPKEIRLRPDKHLVSISVDTITCTYLVVYEFGGIALGHTFDYFKILKDGSLKVISPSVR